MNDGLRRAWIAVLVLSICPAFGQDAPVTPENLYVRRDTWQHSLEASLQRLAALEKDERAAAAGGVELGPWYAAGSFSNQDGKGFAHAYPPEREIRLDADYPGVSGSTVTWRRMEMFEDGQVHSLLPHFQHTEWALCYLYRTITTRTGGTLKASFGSDDGLAVWFNGRKIVSQDVPRGPAPDQAVETLELEPGENHLLLKIVNRTGGWGFYFRADQVAGGLEPWHVIGPFDNTDGKGYTTAYPPETEINYARTYPGMKDTVAAWRPMERFVDGQVHDLRPHFKHADWAIAYLHRVINAKRDEEITGYFGSDDGLAVWLNGEKLIAKEKVPRGPAPDQDKVVLRLKKGRNDLLVKIVNQTGGWGFYFHTKPGGGDPEENAVRRQRIAGIWDRVRADFTSPEDVRQMRDENADGIWPVGWHPNDWASLARRYQDATQARLGAARQLLDGLRRDLGEDECAAETKAMLSVISAPLANPDAGAVQALRAPYHQAARIRDLFAGLAKLVSTGLAVDDLSATYPGQYPGAEFRTALDVLRGRRTALLADKGGAYGQPEAASVSAWEAEIDALQRKALIEANPVLDFGELLFITRRPGGGNPGLPQNWQGNSSMRRNGWDTAISVLSSARGEGTVRAVFQSPSAFVGDLNLSFDATRLLFSMPDEARRMTYQVWEIGTDGSGLRQVSVGSDDDYDNYDGCYLPDGRIMFTSTRCYQAVPCTGGDHVALMYLMDADGSNARQLTFDQDHSWDPTVLNDGRVIYTRWEYNDTPHYFSRILFSMNPDGTRQSAFYGSSSFFPNTMMYPRPIPGSETKIACILSGHHGNPRMGEVAIIDAAQGEREAEGVVRILPERHRKIEPVIVDQYATGKWPQFVQPWPLSDKYFLVSCKPSPDGWWGLYLLDVFDNLVSIRVEPGAALMEPIPLRPRETPPIIPDAVDLRRKDALVYLFDVYRGEGLDGVPRGSIKKLRLIEPVYRYWGNGETYSTSIDGTWDVKRILGTVPVEEDGSAFFRVPANTPIMVQPIDGRNMAQQQMRSWFTAMPGEVLSCVGCHERRREVPTPGGRARAQARPPSEIEPWRGPARAFSFEAEVQPVLDRHCVRCHSKGALDLRPAGTPGAREARFSPAYDSLHPYVRRPGLEATMHVLPPREFEAGTSQLVQMLGKGHFGVQLTEEDWDRLITWIDLNVPYASDWREAIPPAPENLIRRREEIRAQDAWAVAQREAEVRP